jgi:hypothetical protein
VCGFKSLLSHSLVHLLTTIEPQDLKPLLTPLVRHHGRPEGLIQLGKL